MTVPTSQSALKQRCTEETNSQNNDDKAKKPTFGSYSISVTYCSILAYFHITHSKFKAALTILRSSNWAFTSSRMFLSLFPTFVDYHIIHHLHTPKMQQSE